MGRDDGDDRVRLTVPADPEMIDVVRAAVRSLGARLGLGEVAVEDARDRVGDAFLEVLSGADEVVVEARVGETDLDIVLTAGEQTRRIEASR